MRKKIISSWKRICFYHTHSVCECFQTNRIFMPFLSSTDDGKLGTRRKVAVYPVTSTAVCGSPGTETCPGNTLQQVRTSVGLKQRCLPHSRMGQEPESHPPLLRFMGRASFSSGGESHHRWHGKSSGARCYSQVTSGGNERANKHGVETCGILRAAKKRAPPSPPPLPSPERASPRMVTIFSSVAGENGSPCAGQPLARAKHPPTSSVLRSSSSAPMGSDGTEERPWMPLEAAAEERFLPKLLIFASLASSHIAGHSCADRARASYPNNQLGEMVSKPERGWGAPAEHRDRQLTRAVKIRDRKRQNHAFPLRLQAQRSRTSSSPKLAGE